MIAADRLPLRSDLAKNQSERPWPYLVLNRVVVDWHSPIIQVTRHRYPSVEQWAETHKTLASHLLTSCKCKS